MDEEQYAALLAKIAELESRLEAQSHHGMDHGAGDAMDSGVMFREVRIIPSAKPEVATLYLQDNGATNQLMLQHPTGAAINITGGSVTNGDSHDHAGGDGAQIDHGGLAGLSDDDHTQYIKHSLATALSDFLVASGAGAFVKKTLAEVKTILGLGSAAYTASTDYVTHALATAANDFLVASGSGAFVKKTLAEVKTILGLGSAAYTASTDYEPAIANGTANYLRGMNAAANGKEWKQLAGTSNRVTVTHAANLITLNGPQDLNTTAVPTFAGALLGSSAYGVYSQVSIYPTSTTQVGMTIRNYASQTADLLDMQDQNGSALVYFKATGRVGIGLSGPSYLLHVNSDSAGKPGTGGLWTVPSDARIKKDIVPADLARCYEIVKAVPLKRFAWGDGVYDTDQVNDQHNLGWIAQDVQPIFPKAVATNPFTKNKKLPDGEDDIINDCLDLNGGQMLMAMYGAIQQLIIEVEKLQDKKVDKLG